ncbi:receptor like protein 21 [Cajanus cajan]|nr:receptor like protein 21 [Cajanus cajan]
MLKLLFHMELWVVLLGAIVVGYVLGSDGCFQEEKGALLDLKGNESLLASWVDDPKSNCCAWERVTCDSSSGHVIHLALGDLYIGEKEADPHINDDGKSTLMKLETLDLSFNFFNASIMELVGALPSIKTLVLAGNFIGGPFLMKELSLLPNLEVLDLSFNRIGNGSLFATQELSLSPNLEVLDLSVNRLVSPVTTEDAHVVFHVLKKLKTLDLTANNFDKRILKSLVAFSTLRSLCLSYNPIKWGLNDKVLANLSKLEVLQLSNSGVTGYFPNQVVGDEVVFPATKSKDQQTMDFLRVLKYSTGGVLELCYVMSIGEAEEFSERLKRELQDLEAANVHSILESELLMDEIETRNNNLEMQSVNNKSLIEELDKLLERLCVPSEYAASLTGDESEDLAWHAVSSWTWDAQDETCGICRMAFDGCCPDCKLPGDDCPLIWGACNHAFHLHCILKWVNSQTSQAHCPMCRREWQFKGDT